MTSKSFEQRLKWIEQNVKEYQEYEESRRLDEEIEEYRLKRRSREYSDRFVGGVREE